MGKVYQKETAIGRGRAGRPDHDQQHCYHHTPTVSASLTKSLSRNAEKSDPLKKASIDVEMRRGWN
jgi:hypothetical protein